GRAVPELIGKYVFGDIVTGDIFYADAEQLEAGKESPIFRLRLLFHGHETTMREGVVGDKYRADLRFGLGQDGEIYVLTKTDGMIRRMQSGASTPSAAAAPAPPDAAQTRAPPPQLATQKPAPVRLAIPAPFAIEMPQ